MISYIQLLIGVAILVFAAFRLSRARNDSARLGLVRGWSGVLKAGTCGWVLSSLVGVAGALFSNQPHWYSIGITQALILMYLSFGLALPALRECEAAAQE